MGDIFKMLLSLSLSGSLLLFAVWMITRMGRRRFSKAWQYYIWLLVVLRLLIPVTSSSSLVGSAFEWLTASSPAPSLVAFQGEGPREGNRPVAQSADSTQATSASAQAWMPARVDALSVLALLWGAGALTLAVYQAMRYKRYTAFLCAGPMAVSTPSLLRQLEDVCRELGIRSHGALYENSQVPSPLVVGFFKPSIVLPSTKISENEFRLILLHELTHFRRGDPWYKGITQLVLCAHWFNPLVYGLARKINHACELACDEAVIRRLDATGTHQYGSLLIDALQHAREKKTATLLGNAFQQDALAVKERLEAIMKHRNPSPVTTIAAFLTALVLTGGAVGLGAFVPGDSLAESAQSPTPELRTLQAEEHMLLEGKDIFSYHSGMVFALMNDGKIPSGLDIMHSPGPDAEGENLDTLENTAYPVTRVEVYDTGIAGPFGIEVGMTVQTLLSLLPGANEEKLTAENEDAQGHPWYYYHTDQYVDGEGTLYTYQYQDEEGQTYAIEAYCWMDMVLLYSVYPSSTYIPPS